MYTKFDTPPKAGDKVILVRGSRPERVLTVKKVTPTGLVRTEEGLTYKSFGDGTYTQQKHGYIGNEAVYFSNIARIQQNLRNR